jgi:hypothetical protein
MNLAGTETRPYPLSRGRADHGEVDIALDPVLRIDKVLKRKSWQDLTDDPFAESDPALAEPWKAALDGCWRPPRRFLSRGGRSAAAVTTPTRRVSDPGPKGVAARLSVATAGSRSPRFPTKPASTGGTPVDGVPFAGEA